MSNFIGEQLRELINNGGSGGGSGAIVVKTLPTPSAETVSKIYLNEADGNNYVGKHSTKFVVGEPVGNKIYFDTDKEPLNHIEYMGKCLLGVSNGTDTYYLSMVDVLEEQGVSGYGHCYTLGVATSDMSSILGVAYIKCDVLDVATFNEMLGSQFGIRITEFGWQTDMLDISALANYKVVNNYLVNWDYLAYASKYRFEQLNGLALSPDNLVTVLEFPAGSDSLISTSTFIPTEGAIYKFIFGEQIDGLFVPQMIFEGICVGNAEGAMAVYSICNGYAFVYLTGYGWSILPPSGVSMGGTTYVKVYKIGTYTA